MPAIQLARLKLQAGALREYFSQPQAFVRGLRHMLEFYGNRTRRPGQSGSPSALMTTFNTPPPVLRQILLEITPLVNASPEKTLALADALWEQEYLEFRSLAAQLLGMVPVEPPAPVLDRLHKWIINSEPKLSEVLLNDGLASYRQNAPHRFLMLLKGWMESSDWNEQQWGLRAILPLVSEEGFEELPVLFRFLTPLARASTPILRPDLIQVFSALARTAPQETAYFLKQNLVFSDTPWLARQVLKQFPAAQQEGLKTALKAVAWKA